MDDYAHAPVTDDPIVVDFSGCKYLDELYERIKSFGFPACCGKNWDAVWDCIDGYFDENESRTIQIRGFSRCQMNYRNTVNQCGVSFPIYRKNAETLLCVMNRKKAERPEFSLLYLLCRASILTIILSVRFRIFHSSLFLTQKTTSANPFWGWRCGFSFGAHFATRPARVICYSSRYRAGIWACSRSPWG